MARLAAGRPPSFRGCWTRNARARACVAPRHDGRGGARPFSPGLSKPGLSKRDKRLRRPRPKPPAAPGPPRTLRIAALGAQGDGWAAEAQAHVPFTLPGETVVARVAQGRGELETVLEPSPDRVAPPCPHFGACGGCALQHMAHAPCLAWKVEQVRRALSRERIEAAFDPPFASAPGARRRVALHARRGPRADVARLGYKARRSWDLVEVEVCPIAHPRLVEAFPALRRLAAPLLEHPASAPTLHVTLTDTGIDVDVSGVEARSGGLSADARARVAAVAREADLARVTLAGEALALSRRPFVRFGEAAVELPAGGFLQADPAAEAAMAAFAVAATAGAGTVADLFCGAGAFSFRLARHAAVRAVDAAPGAVAALSRAAGSVAGLKAIAVEVRDLDRRPVSAAELKGMDAAVFDPPRAGAEAQARALAESRIGRVVAVSCNPQTFARDAAILVGGGFRLERVLPVDQFLWSPHIELAAVFSR